MACRYFYGVRLHSGVEKGAEYLQADGGVAERGA